MLLEAGRAGGTPRLGSRTRAASALKTHAVPLEAPWGGGGEVGRAARAGGQGSGWMRKVDNKSGWIMIRYEENTELREGLS